MIIPIDFKLYSFSFKNVGPSENEVLKFLQSSVSEDDHPVRTSTKEILLRLNSHNQIAGGYIIKEVESINIKDGTIKIDNVILNVGSQICGYLKEASHIALFVCTGGNIFTRITNEYNADREYLEAFVADAIGSLTVEKAMDKVQEDLGLFLKSKNMKISNRYSPGYCNWALSDQKTLFGLIGENSTGVNLNNSYLMQPIKSVSGIIGIGTDIKKREYGCDICRNTTCIYRKILNVQ